MLFPYLYAVSWENAQDGGARTLELPLISSAEKDKVAGIELNPQTRNSSKIWTNAQHGCVTSLNINQAGLRSSARLLGSHTVYCAL